MKLHLIGCGGTGINEVHAFMGSLTEDYTGLPEILPRYVDTSDTNAKKKGIEKDVFIIHLPPEESGKEVRDGSGKKRTTHAPEIARRVPEVIADIGYNDAVVVVMSGGGGSGGTIGQYAMRALQNEQRIVCGIIVNSFDDAQSRINCHDSMMTLEKMTTGTKMPSVVFAVDNEEGEKKSDEAIQNMLKILAVFLSGKNERLDTSDIAHFFNFPKVTPYTPRLAFMSAYVGMAPEEIQALEPEAIAVASLYRDEVLKSPVNSEYSCHGLLDSNVISQDIKAVHLIISAQSVEEHFKALQKRVFEDEERRKKQAKYVSFAKGVEGDDDMVIR